VDPRQQRQPDGVDIPILLNSTPEETLAHRRSRARDGAVDSPFTTTVLELEQALLHSQAGKARIIVSKSGELIDYDAYLKQMGKDLPGSGPMLNAYPDSIGGSLTDLVALLKRPALQDAFQSAYLLPSIFNTDLDRGFSVIDYQLSDLFATEADLRALTDEGIDVKFDFILNHASVLSPQFQDLLRNGQRSPYTDFFIDWNGFWEGCGEMTPEGYIQPRAELIDEMFFRKPGLPILMVRMPDGTEKPYWNTFYQEVRYPDGGPAGPDGSHRPPVRLGQASWRTGSTRPSPRERDRVTSTSGASRTTVTSSSTCSSHGAATSARWTSTSSPPWCGTSTRTPSTGSPATGRRSSGWTRSPTPRRNRVPGTSSTTPGPGSSSTG
jgi:hypothetical protein